MKPLLEVFLTCVVIKDPRPHILWWTLEHKNCVWTLVHLHYTSQTFQGNDQSLQWNVCAHVNNFLSTDLVECVDFSDSLSGATVGWFISFSKSHNRTERESKGVGRDILIFRTMRTTRKQFPVNWLTSGRLAFTISARQSEAASTNKKMAAQVEGRCGVDKLAFFNKEPTIETA